MTNTPATATTSYKKCREVISFQMQELARRLAHHAERQAGEPKNWGFAGDLEHVSSLLGEIIHSMAGEDHDGRCSCPECQVKWEEQEDK